MSQQPILKYFVSEIDKFLQNFDQQHPEQSLSQHKEIEKYRRIYYLRDVSDRTNEIGKIWEGF